MHKTIDKKRFILFISGIVILLTGAVFIFQRSGKNDSSPSAAVNQAGKVGEKATHQLLVQIERPKGNPEDMSGRYERGDIVLIAPGEKEWSDAEKSGFLILKMDLTPEQAELLTQPLSEEVQPSGNEKEAQQKTLKRRRFAVDFQKIGIVKEYEKVRMVEDKIFGADILFEKK